MVEVSDVHHVVMKDSSMMLVMENIFAQRVETCGIHPNRVLNVTGTMLPYLVKVNTNVTTVITVGHQTNNTNCYVIYTAILGGVDLF